MAFPCLVVGLGRPGFQLSVVKPKPKQLRGQSRSEGNTHLSQPQIEIIHDLVLLANQDIKQLEETDVKSTETRVTKSQFGSRFAPDC